VKTSDLPVWIPPGKINFSRLQLELFIFPNLNTMAEGGYPNEPEHYRIYFKSVWLSQHRSGYIDGHNAEKKLYIIPDAPFLKGTEVSAEVNARINMMPEIYQEYCTRHYIHEHSIDWLSRNTGKSFDDIFAYTETSIRFIKGYRRKLSFKHWFNRNQSRLPII